MKTPKHHPLEELRLKNLDSLKILDTFPEDNYDNIVEMACNISQCPIALITLVDKERQWFKANCGLSASETSREVSFCGHAIVSNEDEFIVPDTLLDDRFRDNPLVTDYPNIRFYAGYPFQSEKDLPLGTLCVIDTRPRVLSEDQKLLLKSLALQITSLLNLRKKEISESNLIDDLRSKNKSLEQFAYAAAHDLKSPLANMMSLTDLISLDLKAGELENLKKSVKILKQNSVNLKNLIDGLIDFSKNESGADKSHEPINTKSLIKELKSYFNDTNVEIKLNSSVEYINTNRALLVQNLLNLLSNAVKYNDKEKVKVSIRIDSNSEYYIISVKDNGPGIDDEIKYKVFDLFTVGSEKDKFGKKGSGIGLSTVRKNVYSLGGDISFTSEKGLGTTFTYTIKR